MTLATNLIPVKNRLDDNYPWLLLLKFALYEGESTEIIYRFVRNNPDIVFKGDTYLGFNFLVSMIEESIDGKIPTVSVTITNVTQYLQSALEEHEGATSGTITFTLVHADLLDEEYDSVEFDILAPHIDANIVSFRLGIPSPLKQRYPLHRYFSDSCPNTFKGARCGYAGAFTFCNRRFVDCIERSNETRYGGVPGLIS